jgi:hypothetical protein
MAHTRIKLRSKQPDARTRREQQTYHYRRSQIFGVLMMAAAILLWTLFHTNPNWLFPPGWWRP